MYSKAEASQIRRQFWVKFDEYSRPYLGKNGKWMTYNTGIKDLVLKFDINRSYARVMLAVECKNEDIRFDVFCKLHECELVLNNYLGEGWVWDEMLVLENGKPVCALYKQIDNVDIYRMELNEDTNSPEEFISNIKYSNLNNVTKEEYISNCNEAYKIH